MPTIVKFKIERREFDRTLKVYKEYSKRDLATICNTKASFIARRACLETPKADKAKIAQELGKVVTRKGKVTLKLAQANSQNAPLAALIVNKRLGPGHGVSGAEMMEKIRQLIAARMKSIAFLKSGWLPAIRTLLGLAESRGAPRQDRSALQIGRAKGSAIPARDSFWRTTATIENAALATRDHRDALGKYGGPALQRAFDAEERSMREYIERKMKEAAHKAGIKTH